MQLIAFTDGTRGVTCLRSAAETVSGGRSSLGQQRLWHMGEIHGSASSLHNPGLVAISQGDYSAARALFEETRALAEMMDDKTGIAYSLLGLGLVDLGENKPEARQDILRSLRLGQEMDEKLLQTSSLIGVAKLALHEGDPQLAARLLGAVESALKALNAVVQVDIDTCTRKRWQQSVSN